MAGNQENLLKQLEKAAEREKNLEEKLRKMSVELEAKDAQPHKRSACDKPEGDIKRGLEIPMTPTEAATSLALSLLRSASSPSDSFILSPFALAVVLAVTHDGAVGDAKKELTTLLLKGYSEGEVSAYYSKLVTLMSRDGDFIHSRYGEVKTRVATRFFVDNGFPLLPDYQKDMIEKYGVDVEKLDFYQPRDAAKAVNDYVDHATNGKIAQIVDQSNFRDVVGVLVNAVHFKASWAEVFYACNTKEQTFHGMKGGRQEKLMNKRFDVPYCEWQGVQAVSLPYCGNGFSFLALLPAAGSFEKFRASLDGPTLLAYISKLTIADGYVRLPKFATESSMNAKKMLQAHGVKGIFDSRGGALIATSTDPRLYITDIFYMGIIEVDEKGTEAAAAIARLRGGGAYVEPPPPKFDFCADRPFLYAIVKDRENLLFLGQFC